MVNYQVERHFEGWFMHAGSRAKHFIDKHGVFKKKFGYNLWEKNKKQPNPKPSVKNLIKTFSLY